MPHHPVVPELAHTRTRPVHWVATAAATAAVVAGAGLLQPAPATGADAKGPVAQTAAPDPAAAQYPLDCHGNPTTVTASATGDLDGDRRPETVVAVRCEAGSGTPPHAVYVLAQDRAAGSPPRVVATLVDTADRQTVEDLTVRGTVVTATLHGYSAPSVPRCCPDRHRAASWRWTGGKFSQQLTEVAPARV
ncbi:hypothetical protein [Streptomyces sp. WAC06614]|uniref:hypothetical protein n=1 Tax=Streptomyces sp. WAC06614 TaxID=2487416 RepID=UPI000F79F474|nr:hypothetical protein [Streptomyces sp. WAC06614]RSS81403.1 hypothetical protein EF918_10370 [Streptomyces sp. WAC06614]